MSNCDIDVMALAEQHVSPIYFFRLIMKDMLLWGQKKFFSLYHSFSAHFLSPSLFRFCSFVFLFFALPSLAFPSHSFLWECIMMAHNKRRRAYLSLKSNLVDPKVVYTTCMIRNINSFTLFHMYM